MCIDAFKNWSLQELSECQQLAKQRPYVGPEGTSCIYRGKRLRTVGGNMFTRPLGETYDEFIIGHLRHVLGDDWFSSQQQLPPNKQHKVMQWGLAMGEERERVFAAAPETEESVLL